MRNKCLFAKYVLWQQEYCVLVNNCMIKQGHLLAKLQSRKNIQMCFVGTRLRLVRLPSFASSLHCWGPNPALLHTANLPPSVISTFQTKLTKIIKLHLYMLVKGNSKFPFDSLRTKPGLVTQVGWEWLKPYRRSDVTRQNGLFCSTVNIQPCFWPIHTSGENRHSFNTLFSTCPSYLC